MNNIYVISDLHLGHEKLALKRGFAGVKEQDELIIDRWNSKVNKRDTIWILGDVVLGGSGNLHILNKLIGVKKLVMGNHDTYPTSSYLKYFNRVYGAVQYKDCVLTHIPVHPSQFPRFRLNIHGHLHLKVIADTRYINVSCEQVNYTPVLIKNIIKIQLGD